MTAMTALWLVKASGAQIYCAEFTECAENTPVVLRVGSVVLAGTISGSGPWINGLRIDAGSFSGLAAGASARKIRQNFPTGTYACVAEQSLGRIELEWQPNARSNNVSKPSRKILTTGPLPTNELAKDEAEETRTFFLPRGDASPLAKLAYQNRNLIIEGVPGTGKTFAFKEICDGLGIEQDDRFVLNCHPSTQYEDVIEGLRPEGAPRPKNTWPWPKTPNSVNNTGWQILDGVFLQACALARKHQEDTTGNGVAILLDELNRANVPKILGDLMTVLEFSKRADYDKLNGAESMDAVTLPLSGRKLAVPSNLIVVATMNSVDQSAAPLDQALLRRFWRTTLEPMSGDDVQKALLANRKQSQERLLGAEAQGAQQKLLDRDSSIFGQIAAYADLNKALEDALGPSGKVGPSFLFDMASTGLIELEPKPSGNGRAPIGF